MSGERKTGENLLKLMEDQKLYMEGELGLKLVGWISDAGGDSKAAQKRLLEKYLNLLGADCLAHQVCIYI